MADRFEDLRNFVTIAEAGGVSAAAARLGIAKSAVSRRMGELEQRLGVALADRSRRRFSLTPEGHSFLVDARRVLADLDRLEARAGRPDRGGPVVAAVDRDLLDLVASAAAQLRASAPELEIAVVETGGTTASLTISGRPASDGYGVVLGQVARRVYGAAGRDLGSIGSPADLRSRTLIAVASSIETDWSFDGVDVAPVNPLRVPDLRSGLVAAAAGDGLVRAPAFAVRAAGLATNLREAFRPGTADLAVVAVRTEEAPDAVERLMDLIAASLAD